MEDENALDTFGVIIFIMLLAVDVIIWRDIFLSRPPSSLHAYFLDVGQGDSELMIFPDGTKIMTDAGPAGNVLDDLQRVMPPGDDYIDLAIISHPQLDHFGGYAEVLDHYSVGAFIYNGRDDTPGVVAWPQLLQKIKDKNIPVLTLGRGDVIHDPTGAISFLSPNKDFDQSAELNDTAFVELVRSENFQVLLTADTGFNVEDFLLLSGMNLHADVLKVGHHGSRYSSEARFLKAVNPGMAVIEVGAQNTYGHPSRNTLWRLASSTKAAVLRTDRDGAIEIWKEGQKMEALKEK